jgi:hypothetical protein
LGADDHFRTSYIPDSLMDGYLEHYEEILGDLLTPRYSLNDGGVYDGDRAFVEHAWNRLNEVLGETEDISDSESVASIGYLGFGDGDDGESTTESREDGKTDWEHLRYVSVRKSCWCYSFLLIVARWLQSENDHCSGG